MKQTKYLVVIVMCLYALTSLAQQRGAAQPGAQRGQAGGQRGQEDVLTPEEQKIRDAAQERLKLPMDALDTVWIEEMTDPEVRAAIAAGKTTGLILTGGVESNGPHLA